jgi:HSP20 family protein
MATENKEQNRGNGGGGGGNVARQNPQQQGSQPQVNQGSAQRPRAMQRNPRQQMGMGSPLAIGPLSLMRRLFDDLDRLVGIGGVDPVMEQMFDDDTSSLAFVPRVDVRQQDDRMLVHVDLPGLAPEDVRLRLDQGALIIEGERRNERESNEGGVWRSERSYGQFQRVIPLPETADVESAEARFENGVLEVSIKAPQRPRGREIPIKTGQAAISSGGAKH